MVCVVRSSLVRKWHKDVLFTPTVNTVRTSPSATLVDSPEHIPIVFKVPVDLISSIECVKAGLQFLNFVFGFDEGVLRVNNVIVNLANTASKFIWL